VLYESITRRLGVKVGLISTSVHTYVSWTPSWPGEVSMKETSFSINIPWNHREERTIIHPDNRNCPENSISEVSNIPLFINILLNIDLDVICEYYL